MPRPFIATVAILGFVFCYILAVLAISDLIGRLHWALEAVYWAVAGVLWTLPVRWLMLWSVGKR